MLPMDARPKTSSRGEVTRILKRTGVRYHVSGRRAFKPIMIRIFRLLQRGILVWTLVHVLHGCGESTMVSLTIDEETAIYAAIFDRVGLGHIDAVAPTTNVGGYGRTYASDDCAGLQTMVMNRQPALKPDLIPAFCQANDVSRPVNPEVIRQLGLETRTLTQGDTVRLSSIQTDGAKTQALVFVQVQDGDFMREVYLFLIQKDGTWSVQDEF
jgi:hypothetical protein